LLSEINGLELKSIITLLLTPLSDLTQAGRSRVGGNASTAGGVRGRVDEQIAKLAGVSRDTVRKVDEIIKNQQLESGQGPLLTPHIIDALERGDISINSTYETLKDAKRERLSLIYRIKKDKEKEDRILLGEKPPNYEQISKKVAAENKQLHMTVSASRQTIDTDNEIIESQTKELQRLKQKLPIQAETTTTKIETEEVTKELTKAPAAEEITISNKKIRIDKLEDYDPNSQGSYDRQTLCKIINLAFDELRRLREENHKLKTKLNEKERETIRAKNLELGTY
jgi:hypothetical protein